MPHIKSEIKSDMKWQKIVIFFPLMNRLSESFTIFMLFRNLTRTKGFNQPLENTIIRD